MLFASLAQRYENKANNPLPSLKTSFGKSIAEINQSPFGMFLLPLSSAITPQSAIEWLDGQTYYVRKGNFGF